VKREAITKLGTEQRNKAALDLDLKSAFEIARIINREDQKIAAEVKKALPRIARAIDWIAAAIRSGGRLIYVGTGTSGRIAALDASECPPTFGVNGDLVQFRIAGGEPALAHASEGSEDSSEAGERDLAELAPTQNDVVVGIAASGRTPYTVAAIEYSRRRGAKTVAVTCNRKSPLERAANLAIVVEVGPEVVAGSSRMKAGTAQKMVLNMLSTGAMTRLGYVYGNQMVNVHTKNNKLIARAQGILQALGGLSADDAERALREAEGHVPAALVAAKAQVSLEAARKFLLIARGNVREAAGLAIKSATKGSGVYGSRSTANRIKRRK
jgi:N-acetylmuramic acid 6-phosphate etherase